MSNGHYFTVGDVTILTDGTRLYSMYANGYAPLSGGGSARPSGAMIGRVWKSGDTWVASSIRRDGEHDSWSDEVMRSNRGFRTRREAALFLHGWQYGHGAAWDAPVPRHGPRHAALTV